MVGYGDRGVKSGWEGYRRTMRKYFGRTSWIVEELEDKIYTYQESKFSG
jgi:hypothetical protein